MKKFVCISTGLLTLALATNAKPAASTTINGDSAPGLRDTVVLIVRHAEKPDAGPNLSPEGDKRALAYVNYFKTLTNGPQHLMPVALFATADSAESYRPRLTLEPLSHASGLKIDSHFKNKKLVDLAADLRSHPHGNVLLIAWHHGEIPELLRDLGADPEKLLPDGKWPGHIFGWMMELHYDHDGHLIQSETKRVNEHLMPAD